MFSKTLTSSRAMLSKPPSLIRHMANQLPSKAAGDISSVFPSLSGVVPQPLPERFAEIKRKLIEGNEERIAESWERLLGQLEIETEIVRRNGPGIIPQIEFEDLKTAPEHFVKETKKRGVAVIRGVVPEVEARNYKTEIEEYVTKNPSTNAFPPDNPQIFELYWSKPQVRARSHPNVLSTQTSLMKMWHSKDKNALISTSLPLTYADRIRIRQPGDNQFALGPHVDGGSVERWEPNGYGLGGVYDKVFQGLWEEYDPWESSARIPAVTDLHQGPGGCSMYRMFQGWLGLSHTSPWEGTLLVNPLLQLATSYFLLRPFFDPVRTKGTKNWKLKSASEMDSVLQGANPGSSQEFTPDFHPHLDLEHSMVHVPKIKPGDFVVWHCDTIHAVDRTHAGASDSSVMYIPVCPMTELNAKYAAGQRDAFLAGIPPPDFPGGMGESEHIGRATAQYIAEKSDERGMRSMGLFSPSQLDTENLPGAKKMIRRAGQLLGFA